MIIADDYTFTPGPPGQGTIEIPMILELEDFGEIINVSRGSILYDPTEGSAGATVSYLAGSTILTLEQTTTYCLAEDRLQIAILQNSGGPGPTANVYVTNSVIDPVNISGPINDGGGSLTVDGTVGITGTVSVSGPLTDSQLRASALPLPTGAATSANQTTANTSLSSIDGKLPALSSGNVPVLPAVQLGSGVITATTQRVVLASDSPTVTTLTSIDTKTPALQSGAVPIGDNSSSLTVDGKAYRVQLDITRPGNTTAYPAGSVIGTGSGDDAILTLANIGPSGGFVIVQSIELVLGISVVPSGMTTFRLHFYSTKPVTAAANASAFDVTSTDRGAYIGYIDMPSPIDLGSTCFTQVDYPGKLLKLAPSSTSLFVEMQTIGGYTPAANSEVYSLRVKTLEAGL